MANLAHPRESIRDVYLVELLVEFNESVSVRVTDLVTTEIHRWTKPNFLRFSEIQAFSFQQLAAELHAAFDPEVAPSVRVFTAAQLYLLLCKAESGSFTQTIGISDERR